MDHRISYHLVTRGRRDVPAATCPCGWSCINHNVGTVTARATAHVLEEFDREHAPRVPWWTA